MKNSLDAAAPVLRSGSCFPDLRWPSALLFIYILLPKLLFIGLETFFFTTFLLFVFIWWAASRERFPEGLSQIISPLILIILIGMLGSSSHDRYDMFKDIWYVSNAALALAVGYALMLNMRDLRKLFRVIVGAGAFIAFFHILPFALHKNLLELDVTDIRKLAGTGYFEPAFALCVMLAAKMMGIRLFEKNPWFSYLALTLCLLSVILSFSRTIQTTLVLMILAVAGWLSFTNRVKVILVVFITASIAVLGMYLTNSWEPGGHFSLFDKFLYSFQEIRVVNYTSLHEINDHWRGYETARALYAYSLGTPWQYVVGQGFGTNIDLGLFMNLGGNWIRFAPVLHNGYMYLLVKTGVVGLFLYLLLLYRVTLIGTMSSFLSSPDMKYCGRLIVGLAVSFASSTFVIGGMFNKTDLLSGLLLLGALLAYIDSRRAEAGQV